MENNYAKILVAAPISDVKDYVLYEWMEHVSQLTYPNYDILLVDNSLNDGYINKFKYNFPQVKFLHINPKGLRVQDFIRESQNKIRRYMLDNNYMALMSIECDVFPPLDVIETLFKHKADIATGLYGWGDAGVKRRPLVQQSHLYLDALRNMDVFRNENLSFEEGLRFIDGKTKEVFSTGLGCALISKAVLVNIPYRTDEDTEHHADTYFMLDAHFKGFKALCDTSVWCRHKSQSWIIQNAIVEKIQLDGK